MFPKEGYDSQAQRSAATWAYRKTVLRWRTSNKHLLSRFQPHAIEGQSLVDPVEGEQRLNRVAH